MTAPAKPASSSLSPRRAAAADAALSPWIVVLMIVLVMMPIELSVQAGDLFLPWYRLVLLIATVPVGISLMTGGLKVQSYDRLIIGLAIWAFMCELLKRGGAGLQPAGSALAETLTAYLLVRVHVRTPEQIIKFIRLTFVLMVLPIAAAIPEAITHTRFIHDFGRSITGYTYNHADDVRLGLLRAESTFQHPILFGLFCSSLFSLSWATARTKAGRLLRPAWLCVGTMMAVTSSALLTVFIQVMLTVGERATRGVKNRLKLLMWGIAAVFAFLSVASNRGPFAIIANTLAFNGGSAYARILQWNAAMDDIRRSPIIGIKPESWTRPFWMSASVDNNWLLMMMKVGIPGLIFMFIIMYMLWRAVYRMKTEDNFISTLSMAWIFTLVTLLLTGATVAFFGKVQTLFYIILAIGGSLALCGDQSAAAPEAPGGGGRRRRAPPGASGAASPDDAPAPDPVPAAGPTPGADPAPAPGRGPRRGAGYYGGTGPVRR